ncbi:MAG: pentapeptide repeat-containing protein [Gammaproteobacteria bacterium]|nr:pentapeptide repeat-containing protein [Gammaproteobacteria bacterium]
MTKPRKTKFEVTNRWSGNVQFTAEIECEKDEAYSVKLGLAVRWGIKSGAYLRDANLRGANLRDANLSDANLSDANLRDANLRDANLSDANLSGANLSDANLRDANLRDANLRGANLRDANLSDANLSGAYLRGANLRGAKDAELAIAQTRILPEGDLVGWKKCNDNILVKVRVPADAKRSHAFGRKCRAEFVEVLEVIGATVGLAQHDNQTAYEVGERVTCDKWCEDWQQECAGGIHFFITKEEAENY